MRSGKNRLVWSYSNSILYTGCPRAYFYYKKLKDESRRADENHNSTPLPLSSVSGIAIHKIISKTIDRWEEKPQVDFEELYRESMLWISHLIDNADHSILDVVNGKTLSPKIYQILSLRVRRYVENFRKNILPQFDGHKHLSHELLSLFSYENLIIAVKPDLCTLDPTGVLVVTDWKTGRNLESLQINKQLGIYAIWAHLEYKVPLSNIVAQYANLETSEMIRTNVTETTAMELTNIIRGDLSKWNKHDISDFPASPKLVKCFECRFLKHCSEGQQVSSIDGFTS